MRIKKICAKMKNRIKDFRNAKNKIKEEIKEGLFLPLLSPPLVTPEGVMFFNTGDLPGKKRKSRRIAEWENIDVDYLNGGGKNKISMEDAQKEVEKLRKAKGACHEHIAYEAVRLVDNKETEKYALHIITGSMAEDWTFMPKENLEDLYAKKPKKGYRPEDIAPRKERDVPGLIKGLFTLVARFWKKITKDPKEDAINRPYMAHFCDPTLDSEEKGLTLLGGELVFQSALERIEKYWALATSYYIQGKKPLAYAALGRIIHLISDMHVPAHVHNDIHGPTVFLGKLDSLEEWLQKKDWKDIRRGKEKMNISIWTSRGMPKPQPMGWNPYNLRENLEHFVMDIIKETQRFRSVDAPGTDPDQKKTGKLTDEECYQQAKVLIPRAIYNSAQIIVNFQEFVSSPYLKVS